MEYKVKIGKSEKLGIRGILAAANFKAGETIEVCPIIPLEPDDWDKIKNSILYYYYFDWEDDRYALPLGYGALYNHSFEPNAKYEFDEPNGNLIFIALKNIKEGEEITINYNYDPEDNAPIDWLKDKKLG